MLEFRESERTNGESDSSVCVYQLRICWGESSIVTEKSKAVATIHEGKTQYEFFGSGFIGRVRIVMSISKPTQATCAYCNGPRDKTDSYEGSFCSKECYHKHRGEKLLNTIYTDHTYCALCGSRLKDIEPPKPEYAFDETGGAYAVEDGELTFSFFGQEESQKAAIGFEYTTDKADSGFKTAYETQEFENITNGIVCGECGNASLFDPQADIRDRFLFEYTSHILDSLKEQREKGVFDCEIDESVVFETVLETGDLPLAIGKARAE